MTAEHTEIQFVLGLDVSCNTVTLYDDHSRCTLTVANDADALRTALQPYQDTATLAVCEATGGHEDTLLGALLELAIPAHRADPAKARLISNPSASAPRPIRSMPAGCPIMAETVPQSCRAGSRPIPASSNLRSLSPAVSTSSPCECRRKTE